MTGSDTTSGAVRAAAAATADPEGAFMRMLPVVEAYSEIVDDADLLHRLAHICGISRALSRSLVTNPRLLDAEIGSWDSVPLRMRAILTTVAAEELMGTATVAESTARLSDEFDALVADRLELTRQAVAARHPMATDLPFAVIAMGKWGAREVNYYSDLDMIFVHDPSPGEENEARTAAFALANKLIADLSTTTTEGTAFKVDLDLRPEGAIGPLSRSLDSFRAYYDRWSEAWELQALLKARPAAGDPDLGRRFRDMADKVVWDRGLDAEALRSIRLLKARAEEGAPPRDIKRSPGGIRDIEFAVQLLQLVHGRLDPDLRVLATLDAVDALGQHGYIEEDEAARLTAAYTFLRNLEHRVQLWELTQTHLVPESSADRDRIARSLGLTSGGELDDRLGRVRGEVRDLHERLYFRPILDSLAGSATARLGADAATLRLAALGFKDVTAATRAFEDMTAGLSRRSRVMQQVLPLMLDWLSQTPDPDLGLAQMRMLLANTTDHGALVTLLQGNPVAGERLCQLLGTGRLLGDLIDRIPEFIPRLADDDPTWDIRNAEGATERLISLLDSRPDPDAKTGTIRRFVRRRKLRIAARDVLGDADTETTLRSLSDSADAAIAGGLHSLTDGHPHLLGVIAMGKWGGQELSYGSDLDLMYVYSGESEREAAGKLATDLERVISEPGRHGDGYQLDAELRPEGRRGPLARSLESYRRYYREWAEPWELLALTKFRAAAGNPQVLEGFTDAVDPVLWSQGQDPKVLHEIRAIKARVEAERIPFGQDPADHLKLGPGGISDIEFVTQLLQLQHGSEIEALRVPGTLPALRALHESEIIGDEAFDSLHEAYLFLTRVRLRLHLQRGQATDWFPTKPDQRSSLAASLGFERQSDLVEQYRRNTRKTRRFFEELFYQ